MVKLANICPTLTLRVASASAADETEKLLFEHISQQLYYTITEED